jgi:hypothetical protein
MGRNCLLHKGLTGLFFLLILGFTAKGQEAQHDQVTGQETRYNPITTAVPFLTIAPDSWHGAMGNVGAATSPDANAQYLNPSKYAFAQGKYGFSVSYTPWLRKLVHDINLTYLSGYYRIDDTQVIGSSLRYFSIGDVSYQDINGSTAVNARPNEFALDFSYSKKLSDYFSGGVALRFIRSALLDGFGQESFSAGNAFATDFSFFYNKSWKGTEQVKTFAAGINFSNIGSKITYNDGQSKEFIPANMRLGAAFTNEFDEDNSLSFSLDLNKLLVPTPSLNSTERSTDKTVIGALFTSFSDAPGGFKEEIQEFTVSTGVEYLFNRKFALRTGYFNESKNKGNRKFFTTGVGAKMNICSVDFSYLIPVVHNSPLANVIRFSISFDEDSFKGRRNR